MRSLICILLSVISICAKAETHLSCRGLFKAELNNAPIDTFGEKDHPAVYEIGGGEGTLRILLTADYTRLSAEGVVTFDADNARGVESDEFNYGDESIEVSPTLINVFKFRNIGTPSQSIYWLEINRDTLHINAKTSFGKQKVNQTVYRHLDYQGSCKIVKPLL